MKRPNEASVTIDYSEANGTERRVVHTGKKADILQMVAHLSGSRTRYEGFTESPYNINGFVQSFCDDIEDELKKALPFVETERLAETCLEMAARLILYVEEVCWQPEKWRKTG